MADLEDPDHLDLADIRSLRLNLARTEVEKRLQKTRSTVLAGGSADYVGRRRMKRKSGMVKA